MTKEGATATDGSTLTAEVTHGTVTRTATLWWSPILTRMVLFIG